MLTYRLRLNRDPGTTLNSQDVIGLRGRLSGLRLKMLSCFGAILILLLYLCGNSQVYAQRSNDNLPVYTSPIDVTGLKIQLRAMAPDRDSGRPVEVVLPVGLIGPKLGQLFSTPLSSQIDQYWNATPDPKTSMTARQAACDGKGGIKEQVGKEVAKQGNTAYDIACELAATGKLVVKQVGSTMYLGYLLTSNSVSFASTSPYTCKNDHGTPFCPNDPRFTVRFSTEIVTLVRTPSLCQITAEGGTVYVVAASFESKNGAADVAKLVKGKEFIAGEVALTNTMRNQPLPIDNAFKELRTSDACTGRAPGVSRILTAFRDLEAVIDLRQGIILRASHAGLTPPTLDVPNPGGVSVVPPPSVPSFTRPTVSTSQPLVTAGNAIQARGQYFPPNSNLATTLPVSMQHGGYGANSAILGGVCFGGATELSFGPPSIQPSLQRLPGDGQGKCAASYNATNLTPNTAYQFRARDCDPITCSQWSATVKVVTAKVDDARGKVLLTLDSGTPLGTTSVNAQGAFEASITIPAATTAGIHTIRAINGEARADVSIQVAASSTAQSPAGGRKASITMIGLLGGETGCPSRPITSTQTDDTFMLFGAGFAPGAVAIRLDTVTGLALGSASVRGDGSICQRIQSAPGNKAGAHTLVALQNGVVVAQAAVTFVQPSIVR